MGLVLLKFDISDNDKFLVQNLIRQGVIYFRPKTSSCLCFISHDLQFNFWHTISLVNYDEDIVDYAYEYINLKKYNPEPTATFKIFDIVPTNNYREQLFALIKHPTIPLIKAHPLYLINMVKHLLLSHLSCFDVRDIIIDRLFWLEINDVFVANPLLIGYYDYSEKKVRETFKNVVSNYPYNWMF
uniref:Uncharacterized protein n=1 Tax=viral metagenome TaxID=1070528 RepID=A0A6C0CAS3_9ZZZZ